MFPIDSETLDYDRGMMEKFDRLIAEQPFTLRDLLPQVLPAGVPANWHIRIYFIILSNF